MFIEYKQKYTNETVSLIKFSHTINVYQALVVQHVVKCVFQSEGSLFKVIMAFWHIYEYQHFQYIYQLSQHFTSRNSCLENF